ncbi:MAG: tape measure protein [Sediminibacterium sp.]|nr:tape measure protein [Sediminibacterium sp.]MDP3128825.1 tape measure protein [Sediminibacterium sp.]
MNQKLTFTAFLQDEYSRKFDKLAERTDADVKKIAKDLDKLSTSGKKASHTIDELDRRIKVLTQARKVTLDTSAIKYANSEIKALQIQKAKLEGDKTGPGGGGGFLGMGIGSGIAVSGALALGAATVSLVKSSAQAYMNYEAIVQSFQVLTKNDGIGKGLADRLNKFQQETILGPEVFKSAQTLLGFGVSVNEVEKDLVALGNVSMGNTDRFNALTLAFSQTHSAGKLMGQDLLQYVNAGFNPLSIMAERWKDFGFKSKKTVGDLKKDMEKGLVTSAQVKKAFDIATGKGGLFEDMLNKVGKTSFGQQKQLEGQWESLKIAIGERFKPELEGTLSLLSSTVSVVKSWVEIPIDKKIGEEVSKIRALHVELTNANTKEGRRKELLLELEKINPKITEGIDKQKVSYEKLAENIGKVTEAMQRQITLSFITKENASLISDYQELQDARALKVAKMRSRVYDIDPKIAADTSLSEDQKTAKVIAQINKNREQFYIDNPKKRGYATYGTDAEKYLQGDVGTLAIMDEKLTRMKPAVEAFKKKAETLGKGIDEFLPSTNKGDKNKPGSIGASGIGTDTSSPMASISGGSKITNLTISIGSLISGGMTVQSTTVKEGASKVRDIVIEELLTSVNDANLAVGR